MQDTEGGQEIVLSRYLEQLVNSENNLMVFMGDELVFQSQGRGIAPLIEAIDTIGRENLIGVVTADRVVGKAAALMNLYMGPSKSTPGLSAAVPRSSSRSTASDSSSWRRPTW